jgi:hypothetical protein
MTNVALAIPLMLVAIAQAMDQPAPAQAPRANVTVDLTPSTTNTVASTDIDRRKFEKLFVRPTLTPAAEAQPGSDKKTGQKRTPRVVCGMVVLPAPPDVDPKIVVPPSPQDANARIRRIVPDVCVD